MKDRVVRALSNFEYDALTFNFDEESGEGESSKDAAGSDDGEQ